MPTSRSRGDATIGKPATAAAITASIPVLIQLAKQALKRAERQGAPADPRLQAVESEVE